MLPTRPPLELVGQPEPGGGAPPHPGGGGGGRLLAGELLLDWHIKEIKTKKSMFFCFLRILYRSRRHAVDLGCLFLCSCSGGIVLSVVVVLLVLIGGGGGEAVGILEKEKK